MAYVLTGQTIQISGYFTEAYKKNLLLGEDITIRFFSLGDSDINYFIDETLNKVPEISGDDDADCIKSLSAGQILKYELNVDSPSIPVLNLIGEEPLFRLGNQPQSFNIMISEAVGYDIPFRLNVIINELRPFNASYINRITFGTTIFSTLADLLNNTFVLRAGETMLENPIVIFFNSIPNDGQTRSIQLIVGLIPMSATENFNISDTLLIERRNNFASPIEIANLSGTQGQPLIANLTGTISYPITYTISPTNTNIAFTEGTTHTLLSNIVQSGLYSVSVRDSFNNTDTKTINIETTTSLSASLVYDNNGNFTVTTQNGGSTIRYELLRNGTEVIFNSGLITNNNQPFIINLTDIINGSYTVRVTSGGQTAVTNSINIQQSNPTNISLTVVSILNRVVTLSITGVNTSNSHTIRFIRTRDNFTLNVPLNFNGSLTQEFILDNGETYNSIFIEGGTNRQSNSVTFTTQIRNNNEISVITNSGCFGFGTKITMSNNTTKNIEDIKVGEQVLSLDIPSLPKSEKFSNYANWELKTTDRNFQYRSAIVKNVFFNDYSYYFIINENTKATFEHPFLIERNGRLFFLQTKDLKKGDNILNVGGEFTKINKIERMNLKLKTVNINVEPYDVYFADGFLVHNSDDKTIIPSF